MKYNLRKIMLKAWKTFRKTKGISFAEALHRAWLSAKAEEINEKRIQQSKAAAGLAEEVNTWAGWKQKGFEVLHGTKALFNAPSSGEARATEPHIKRASLEHRRYIQ